MNYEDHDICICNGSSDGTLICCSTCHTWYHCDCVGVDESQAKTMDSFICEFCSFEDPNEVEDDEDEYVFEKDESPKRKRDRSDSRKGFCISNGVDGLGGAMEEMNEKSVMKAICSIEQRLLLEDISPSIHDIIDDSKVVDEKEKSDDDLSAVLSSFTELKTLRNDLIKKKLLHRLVFLKDMVATGTETKENENASNSNNLDNQMQECVDELCQYDPPSLSIPINADIRTFDWEALGKKQFEITGRFYDVIMMDPPWQLATANPTRGVAIAYEQLGDGLITDIPLAKIQTDGYLFIWVINAKYRVAFVDEIAWVKCNRSRRMAKSHGFYLQHSKETCFVAKIGNPPPLTNFGKESDVIYSERLGQSQKPIDIYELIERLVPNGYFVEVFGRRNNLRNNWVTLGNEL